MKKQHLEEFDLEVIYQKLISPSKPRMIKASDFFTQPDYVAMLKRKLEQESTQCVTRNA